MVQMKYHDKVRKAQAVQKPAEALPPFDPERLRTKGISGRIAGFMVEEPRWWLALMRRWWPNPRFGNFVIVTRNADVREVLERQDVFHTPFGPEMKEMAKDANFILGMQDGAEYRRLKSPILSAFPPDEVERRVRPIAERHAREIMRAANPGFNAVGELLKIVPVRICRDYFGMTIDDEDRFADWSIALSSLFFADPTGSPETRELAVVAAHHMRAAIDLSIGKAQRGEVAPDTPLARLVAINACKPEVISIEEIRSVMMGMISGFAPTNLLAAGNCLDVFLSKPEAYRAARDAVEAGDTAALDKAVLEAMRFKPIFLGPFRYAAADATIAKGTSRERFVPKGATVWPSTLSAMFDAEAVIDPESYDPNRSARDNMVYGHGIHWCIGSAIARVQIGECMRVLFQQRGLRRSAGKPGRLTRRGAFPERLCVDFDLDAVSRTVEHSYVTVAAKVREGVDVAALRRAVEALGNPAGAGIRAALDETRLVHFASLSVIGAADPKAENPGDRHDLVLEFSADGTEADAIAAVAEKAGPLLRPVFEQAGALSGGGDFAGFLRAHSLTVGPQLGATAGLVFTGTPGHAVCRIKGEADIEAELRGMLAAEPADPALSPLARLERLRSAISSRGGYDWAFHAAPSTLEGPVRPLLPGLLNPLTSVPFIASVGTVLTLLALVYCAFLFGGTSPLAVIAAVLVAGLCAYALGVPARPLVIAVAVALVLAKLVWIGEVGVAIASAAGAGVLAGLSLAALTIALAAAIVIGGAYLWLLSKEKTDAEKGAPLAPERFEPIAERENRLAHNHLAAISIMKPGLLRRITLRLAFYAIKLAATRVFEPGRLSDIGSIHYARWVLVPGTDKLLFFSNYGGSWGSYLEDFITKAHNGLTGVWSNTMGFPRTEGLFQKGATNGALFKLWAREQQIPTLFWYSAYPELTTFHIRRNAAIRHGFATAKTDTEAAAFLSSFGSTPMAATALETDEVQSIVFGGMSRLKKSAMIAVRMPQDLPAAERALWLDFVLANTSFGNRAPETEAMIVAIGASGLHKLGLGQEGEGVHGLPTVFQRGMAATGQERVLGDLGDSASSKWAWGAGHREADAVLVCYALEDRFDGKVAETVAACEAAGMEVIEQLPIALIQPDGGKPVEHFGFRDGASQPVIDGVRRPGGGRVDPQHRVAAGEFLLGYPDQTKAVPPTIAVPAGYDRAQALPALAMAPAGGEGREWKDFGRNGSFLVVRQLAQHVDRFEDFCSAAAARLGGGTIAGRPAEEWVGAKMFGRWKDGASLVRSPDRTKADPVPGADPADNAFLYEREDPQGLSCPLGAHVRRSNPRDSLGKDPQAQLELSKRHRLLRISRAYDHCNEKGILFMCLNADIERQFEFVQQSWVLNPNFQGLHGEQDPVVGHPQGNGSFTIPTPQGPLVLQGLSAFVTTRGGGYFFMPGRRALRYLRSRAEGADIAVLDLPRQPAGCPEMALAEA